MLERAGLFPAPSLLNRGWVRMHKKKELQAVLFIVTLVILGGARGYRRACVAGGVETTNPLPSALPEAMMNRPTSALEPGAGPPAFPRGRFHAAARSLSGKGRGVSGRFFSAGDCKDSDPLPAPAILIGSGLVGLIGLGVCGRRRGW